MACLLDPRKRRAGGRNVLCVVLLIFAVCIELFCLTYKKIYVVGSSMLNTIVGAASESKAGGDYVYIFDGTPRRGNVVVASVDGRNIIKRVVALGGDYVEIKDGVLYVNGVAVDEYYLAAENNTEHIDYPYTRIDDGYMFCLGDNRDSSRDSRVIGEIPLDNLVGIVADWSIEFKSVTTFFNTFFDFTLPGLFGKQ